MNKLRTTLSIIGTVLGTIGFVLRVSSLIAFVILMILIIF